MTIECPTYLIQCVRHSAQSANNKDEYNRFGSYIRLVRKKRNLSLEQLANQVGIATNVLIAIEEGIAIDEQIPKKKLSESLGISFEVFEESNQEVLHLLKILNTLSETEVTPPIHSNDF